MAYLRSVGERYDPDHPFEYNFLDDRLEDFYRTELQTAGIFRVSAGLAVFIACLGLLGLTAYTTARRTREIGIRKALGASVPGILALLSRETLQLIALAFLIAAPVDLFLMARWLDRFAYRAPIGWTLPLTALFLTILFALLTVSYQTFRAASVDPVESLRYE
jgi:putative ABC transport system permease protein